VHKFYSKKVSVIAQQQYDNVRWFVSVLLPYIIAFIGVRSFVFRQPQIVTGEALSFGKSRANLLPEVNGRVTFVNVADAEETKQDLQETVEFLRELVRFPPLVGRFPRGGVPFYSSGAGKMLLARAIAEEANVLLFTISDSDVVELFGGVWPLSVGVLMG